MGLVRNVLAGAAAGAAGTTALNATTYLDMVTRGRGTSSTPEQSVETIAGKAHVTIPGDEGTRPNRVSGLGALSGIGAGVVMGALLGAARGLGWRPGARTLVATATVGALVGTNGPMTVLGITDPRTWSGADWASDLVPHAAYGAVTAATLAAIPAD